MDFRGAPFFWRNRGLLGCSPRHQQGRVKGWAVQSFVQLTEELKNIDLSRSKVHIDHHWYCLNTYTLYTIHNIIYIFKKKNTWHNIYNIIYIYCTYVHTQVLAPSPAEQPLLPGMQSHWVWSGFAGPHETCVAVAQLANGNSRAYTRKKLCRCANAWIKKVFGGTQPLLFNTE